MTNSTSNTREFAPGVRIDWTHRLVEIDAKVVLRKGLLELLACSPQTREHESILVVSARPMHIFQALGLIGLEAGRPMRYNIASEKWIPPTGGSLNIQIRYRKDGIEQLVPVYKWVVDTRTNQSPKSLNWVLAGSRTLPGGKYLADVEGTVICVVDFEAALIALNTLHSADNELLWLAANTEAIPPIGTPCTLILKAENDPAHRIDVVVSPEGHLQIKGISSSTGEIVTRYRRLKTVYSQAKILLIPRPGVKKDTMDKIIEAFVQAGIRREVIQAGNTALRPQ